MCVVSAPLMVFGIDRQGKIDAVHTIVLVDDQGRVEKELKEHSMHASSSERTTSTRSQPWTWPSCWSNGHGRVAGVMDMAELLELLSFWNEKLKWCVGRKGLLSPGLRHVELQISGRVN